ncbi:MAG TPA: hypothetical protein VMT19_02790 [Thermoanaerobaculaceae bacterium]|nr:hypothetical protein [Thermoanaerobaculaceae bacterium]
MADDARDELWKVSFETYYESYYQEMLAARLINRWQRIDDVTRFLVAVTASGSAVSGWALWTVPDWKALWGCLAGLAALLSTGHTTLNVPGRLRDLSEVKRRFAGIRIDLETFRYRIQVDSAFPVEPFAVEFDRLRQRYREAVEHTKDDILEWKRLRLGVQDNLDVRLGDQIEKAA